MDFREAYAAMKKGAKVRRPDWGGYWCIENDTVMMYCRDGKRIDIFDTQRRSYTLNNIAADDFEIAKDKDIAIFPKRSDFGTAIALAKNGHKIARDGWNGRGMFVVYQKGYPKGIPCNKQTAEAWGMNEGELFVCNPYLQIKQVNGSHSMWVPSVGDVLAEDWHIFD